MINISENITVLTPGDELLDNPAALKIYLAGSMSVMEGDAFDWQTKFIKGMQILTEGERALLQFKGKKFIVCNPRAVVRNAEKNLDNPEFTAAMNWKFNAMNYCDGIVLNFLKRSVDPMPIMELGYIVKSGKAVVRCPEEYKDSALVKYMCQRFQIPYLPEGRAGDVLSVLQTLFSYVPRFQQIKDLESPE